MKIENKRIEKKIISVDVDHQTIKIEENNSNIKLFVNDKLQDIYPVMTIDNARMYGRLSDGKKIKVVVGGNFKIHHYIFVDDELVLED